MGNLVALIPLVLFLAVALGISFVARRRSVGEGGFVKEYFIGNRTLGGFVLAMTTIATYGSVSSFVGGPGQAWLVGWGWVYMAVVQVTALVLLYGIMGKKLALVARKLDAVTVIDVVRARYNSNALANISAVIVVLFFAATMVAQFVGGAKLFEAVTGYSYMVGLVLFGAAVILFTTIGGFRGVAFTDALCGIIMLVGIGVLAAGILTAGGGYGNIMETIKANHPAMLEPFSGGSMPATLYFIGLMLIGVTALGVLSAGVLTGSLADYGSSVDNIIPRAIAQTLPSWAAGVAIIGPIAASISTVSSLLIASSSAIIKDVYLHSCEARGVQPSERGISRGSQAVTLCVGAIVFALAVVPPDVIWKINMFAFGGLETAFFWVMVCGLFWKRAGKLGALLSMVGGTVAYCACMALGFKVMGLHQIVIGITVAGVLMVVGSLIEKRPQAEQQRIDQVFFPE